MLLVARPRDLKPAHAGAQAVEAALAALSEDDLKCYQGTLEKDGQFTLGEHVITSAMVEIKPEQRKLSGRCAAALQVSGFQGSMAIEAGLENCTSKSALRITLAGIRRLPSTPIWGGRRCWPSPPTR